LRLAHGENRSSVDVGRGKGGQRRLLRIKSQGQQNQYLGGERDQTKVDATPTRKKTQNGGTSLGESRAGKKGSLKNE